MNWLKKLFKKKEEPKPPAPDIPDCYFKLKRSMPPVDNTNKPGTGVFDSILIQSLLDEGPNYDRRVVETPETSKNFGGFNGGDFSGAGSSGSWDNPADSIPSDNSPLPD